MWILVCGTVSAYQMALSLGDISFHEIHCGLANVPKSHHLMEITLFASPMWLDCTKRGGTRK